MHVNKHGYCAKCYTLVNKATLQPDKVKEDEWRWLDATCSYNAAHGYFVPVKLRKPAPWACKDCGRVTDRDEHYTNYCIECASLRRRRKADVSTEAPRRTFDWYCKHVSRSMPIQELLNFRQMLRDMQRAGKRLSEVTYQLERVNAYINGPAKAERTTCKSCGRPLTGKEQDFCSVCKKFQPRKIVTH